MSLIDKIKNFFKKVKEEPNEEIQSAHGSPQGDTLCDCCEEYHPREFTRKFMGKRLCKPCYRGVKKECKKQAFG